MGKKNKNSGKRSAAAAAAAADDDDDAAPAVVHDEDELDYNDDDFDMAGAEDDEEYEDGEAGTRSVHPRVARLAEQMAAKKSPQWKNRQRTLVFAARGISFRMRHLLYDMRVLMPHSKKEGKVERKENLHDIIPELCEMRNCNNCVFLEMRRSGDAYMWLSKMPHGPSVRFLLQNVYTMDELKLTGNALRGSRPLLHFDEAFNSAPHWRLIKELFFQAFGTPKNHPKSKPFVDHIMSFFILDNRVWIRNYQITWAEQTKVGKDATTKLTELGPRLVLQPIRIFERCFGGPTLYQNPDYVNPHAARGEARKADGLKKRAKIMERAVHVEQQKELRLPEDEVATVFEIVDKAVHGRSSRTSATNGSAAEGGAASAVDSTEDGTATAGKKAKKASQSKKKSTTAHVDG